MKMDQQQGIQKERLSSSRKYIAREVISSIQTILLLVRLKYTARAGIWCTVENSRLVFSGDEHAANQ